MRALLPQTDASGFPLTGADLARTVENGFVVGGVRISQRRAAAVACPRGAYFGGAYAAGSRCASADASAGGFEPGENGFDLANVTEAGYANEFTAFPLAFDTSGAAAVGAAAPGGGLGAPTGAAAAALGPRFHHFISAFSDAGSSSLTLGDLVSWGWVDRWTTQLTVGTSVLFPDIGYVAQLSLVASLTRGGRVTAVTELRSMALDPYADAPGLAVLDVLICVYIVYLGLGSLKRAVRLLCIGKGAARDARMRALFSCGTALDWATVAALAAAAAQYGAYLTRLQAAREALQAMPSGALDLAAPDVDAGANATEVPGAAVIAFPPAWAAPQVAFGAASAALASAKTAAVWALILLSCRIFKYVAFQSRLSVLTDTLWAARDDLLHFGLLFGLMCCCFGYWAYFAFGTQDASFYGAGGAALNFWRVVMWEYNL